MLGLAIENRTVAGESRRRAFRQPRRRREVQVLLKKITEQIPTHAVIFDVSTDRGIRSGNQMLTEIMYRLFLQSLGYASDLDLSELEITLEEKGQLEPSRTSTGALQKDWDARRARSPSPCSEASQVLHSLDPDTYPTADSWVKAVKNRPTSPRASSPSAP